MMAGFSISAFFMPSVVQPTFSLRCGTGRHRCHPLISLNALQAMISLSLSWKESECISMASITIRKLDESLKSKLRIRAAYNNRSMEDEVRNILQEVLADTLPASGNLGESIHRRCLNDWRRNSFWTRPP